MPVNLEDCFEARPPTVAELAELIKTMRKMKKWSQATLAELARVTERTIQRVENGEPSSLDTQRALARAFGYENLDTFDKACSILNLEKLQVWMTELEKTIVILPITRVKEARTLRSMIEEADSSAIEEIGDVSSEAREAFMSIVDYLRDYNDIRDAYSMSQRLEIDRDIDALLRTILDSGAAVGAGLRHARVRFKSNAPNSEPVDWANIYFVLAPTDALPSDIRVPKAFRFA